MRTTPTVHRTASLTGLALATILIATACGVAAPGASRLPHASEDVVETPRPDAGRREPAPQPSETPEPRGSEDWRQRTPADGRIAAYTTRISAPAGARIGLKVSTDAPGYRVWAFRIGWYRGGTGTLVWSSGPMPGHRQDAPVLRPAETRTVVAPWRRNLTLDTSGWEPGFYVLKLRASTGVETLVPYVVSSPSAAGTVALVAPVTTWQAYNAWGGYSLYTGPAGDRRSWAVSFDRPFNGATGANDYRTAAIPVVVRAERMGIPLSYFTNVDLDQDPSLLDGATGYVSMGHDEYWTTAMRDTVERARNNGTNLAFLGANTMYWRIRLDDTDTGPARLQTGYRSDAHLDPLREENPEEATSRFRDPPAAESEQSVLGMEYECFPVNADYVIASPTWWGFRGTGVSLGDRMAQLVGPEADRVYLNASTPRPLEVLSHTSYGCRGVTTTSQSVYYTTRSGAGVFSAGTLRWDCALADRCDVRLGEHVQRFVERVTENVLRAYAAGPVGGKHPARDTVTRYDLPDVNSVEAS
jgi:hypothetical protein